jgi:hypothetical protein
MFLLCILEVQWGYHTINNHDLVVTLFEVLEGWGMCRILGQH